MPENLKTIGFTIAVNLLFFVLIAYAPAFNRIHHHWIFPILAFLFALQWAGALLFQKKIKPFLNLKLFQDTILFLTTFLLVMGVVRRETILGCFDRCSAKLAFSLILSAMIYAAQSFVKQYGFWNPVRSRIAMMGCVVWSSYLILFKT